ncbi:MAG: radical SAM/SPASM domain-containing protein [Chloroflexota bacterium]
MHLSDGQTSRTGPTTLIWLLTTRCNLECRHCYVARFERSTDELTPEQARDVLQQAVEHGLKYVGFSGGEFLLRPDALSLVRQASRAGLSSGLVTNGSTISDEVAEVMAETGTSVYLSLDGATPAVHERVRGYGTFNDVSAAVKALKRAGASFRLVFAASRLNADSAAEAAARAQNMGAEGFCLIPVMPTGRATPDMTLSAPEYATVLRAVERRADKLCFPVQLWCTPFAGLIVDSPYVSWDYCRQNDREIDIMPDGTVHLCDVPDFKVTDIRHRSVAQAYEEQERMPLVRSLRRPRTLPSSCVDCDFGDFCLGGCYARAYLTTDRTDAPDPLCPRVSGIAT